MGLVMRPVSKEDIKQATGEVRDRITKDSVNADASVVSKAIFGERSKRGEKVNSDIYNRKGYINLAIPVLNFFLANEDVSLLKRVLKVDAKAIAEATCFRIDDKDGVGLDQMKGMVYSSRTMIGGDYLLALIDELDVEKSIVDELQCIVDAYCKKGEVVACITKSVSEYWMIDEYYVDFAAGTPREVIEVINERMKKDRASWVSGYSSRIPLLLSLRKSKSAIRDQVMNKIFVLPIGYRPTIEKRKDKMTVAYDKVIGANSALANVLMTPGTSFTEVREKYYELVDAVKNVTVKQSSTNYSKDYKPLAEQFAHKEGLFRNRMDAGRTDYSGRGVIVCDPYMSVDTVGIPEKMARKLLELDILRNTETTETNKSVLLTTSNADRMSKIAAELLEGMYINIGRQPTLYRLGIQALKATVVKGFAIVMNPLATPAFNADFDGDQMHASMPQTEEGRRETRELLASTNNVLYARNGECNIAPRQEILFGLWKACNAKCNEEGLGYEETTESLISKVITQEIEITDSVKLNKGVVMSAGRAAVKACFTGEFSGFKLGVLPLSKEGEDKSINEKWFKEMIKYIALRDKKNYVRTVNNLTRLGFAVSNIHSPNISVLNQPNVTSSVNAFDARIAEREILYNKGFETEEAFTAFYDREYAELEKEVKNRLKEAIGRDNGNIELVESGARGNMSNMVQLFGLKGRIKKNKAEVFNAIIKNPLVQQLTGLEHMVTAYGARDGLIDKTIATYKPGYLSRKLEHTTSAIYVKAEDCGTSNGILLEYNFIKQFIPANRLTASEVANNRLIKDYVVKLILGRYVVGEEAQIKREEDAARVYDKYIGAVVDGELQVYKGLKLRSPITCEKPCCVKCYGEDLSSGRLVIKGTPIGFLAAQSIGQPGTQLTMKNFQNGGVAGVSNLTSSFDTMEDYLNVKDLSKGNSAIAYDFIAPVEGQIKTVALGDGTKRLNIVGVNSKGKEVQKLLSTVRIREDIELKDYVKAGESVQMVQGDLNVCEIVKSRSVEEAQKYVVLKLYDIFQKEVYVNLKHFETLVTGMTLYLCLRGNYYFKTGLHYSIKQYWEHDREGCEFETVLHGVKRVPALRTDMLSAICMEDVRKGIAKAAIMSGYDSLEMPITRRAFGLRIGMGSDVEGFVEARGGNNV